FRDLAVGIKKQSITGQNQGGCRTVEIWRLNYRLFNNTRNELLAGKNLRREKSLGTLEGTRRYFWQTHPQFDSGPASTRGHIRRFQDAKSWRISRPCRVWHPAGERERSCPGRW